MTVRVGENAPIEDHVPVATGHEGGSTAPQMYSDEARPLLRYIVEKATTSEGPIWACDDACNDCTPKCDEPSPDCDMDCTCG